MENEVSGGSISKEVIDGTYVVSITTEVISKTVYTMDEINQNILDAENSLAGIQERLDSYKELKKEMIRAGLQDKE